MAGDGAPGLGRLSRQQLYGIVQRADVAPPPQVVAAPDELDVAPADLLARRDALEATDLASLNEQLERAGLQPVGRRH